MRTVAFCEIDPFCRRVLAKHWPHVLCYDNITTLTAARLAADGISAPLADADSGGQRWPIVADEKHRSSVQSERSPCDDAGTRNIDVICGGFPCQDISVAGKGAGMDGARSGLWSEYARIIGEVRPRYVIVENVAALLGRGLERVLGDLAALGYDAEWHCIPASAVGAPHRRDRLWIVAYPHQFHDDVGGFRASEIFGGQRQKTDIRRGDADVAAPDVANSKGVRWAEGTPHAGRRGQAMFADEWPGLAGDGWWLTEPDVGRVAHGVPERVHRLRSLGNAVVPQIPEMIGRAIMRGLTQ
jgi:DNA (cytosine-5)-methyltransferase 1